MMVDDDVSKPGRLAILYDCAYPFVAGGGQKRLFEIARRLVRKGWSIDWYAFQSWPNGKPPVVDGIRFIPVAPAGDLYGPGGKRSIKETIRYGLSIARFARLGGYDLLHLGQWPYFHFFPSRLFAWFGGARISADWWETWGPHWIEYYNQKGRLGIFLERLCAHIPKRLVAISVIGGQQLAALGVDPRRISIIHNGIDVAAIAGAKPAATSDLIYLGRLQPHKNVDLLIDALGLLRDRGTRLALIIVGGGPEGAALQAHATRLGLTDQIRFTGAVAKDEEAYALLQGSRVFVHPSTKEGGGSITSLEANAAGLSVLAFQHPNGISPELIEEGVNGYWVAEVSAETLADGIERAIAGADGARREVCRAFAASFDWDGIADQYHALFLSQMAPRR